MIPRLHLVTDDRVLSTPRFQKLAEGVMEAGGEQLAVHIRAPDSGGRRLWERVVALAPVARRTGSMLLVNDRVDIALLAEVDGVQLPERGLPVKEARALLPPGRILGLSLHEARALKGEDRPDFALVGTLFVTPSHPGRPGAGPGRITRTRRLNPDLPLLGIGGVGLDRVPPVMSAGAHGVALLRAVWDHPAPDRSVGSYLDAIHNALRRREEIDCKDENGRQDD